MSDPEETTLITPPPADQWDEGEEAPEEIPPRRRLLTPLTGTLVVCLLVGIGFLGGVVAQKHSDSGSSSSSLGGAGGSSGLAQLLGGGGAGSTAGLSALFGQGGGGTSGQVKVIDGSTLYINESSGKTIKVKTSAATEVTKPTKASVGAIYPRRLGHRAGKERFIRGDSGRNDQRGRRTGPRRRHRDEHDTVDRKRAE